MKRSEGWDIKLRKKIKGSLSIKVFLWVFSALTVCCILIYGVVLTVLPKQYQITSDKKLDINTEHLVSKLQNMHYEAGVQEIYNFCIQNNSTAVLSDGKETLNFGEIQTDELKVSTSNIATMVSFLDSNREYALVISSLSQTADTILSLLLRFLPVVFTIILLLSALSAYICSKVIVSPIAEISEISRRMTLSDMTWKCDIRSSDEIGVLASSLNIMAERLQKAMDEQRNFFAAVSHELKTPLTILKGQIENMIWGYGDYKNHDKYLPEALKATENIENLVKEIISITKMESMSLDGTLQEVSLKQTINDMVQAILLIAQKKDIRIQQDICKEKLLLVNESLWRKALSNIIGNAVQYSPCGEEVFISLQSSEKGDTLIIENTGVSISEADLPQMFTPFYRADKSRSKETGGSGLGMYIVKTILDLHGMNCCIKNTQQGVGFYIFF